MQHIIISVIIHGNVKLLTKNTCLTVMIELYYYEKHSAAKPQWVAIYCLVSTGNKPPWQQLAGRGTTIFVTSYDKLTCVLFAPSYKDIHN